ncbi:MAG: DUF3800 domain-containing protein [Coriobacteriia bacterium]|nr:DUF3800 domain-containing protein [Coriobacteriia bacterium]
MYFDESGDLGFDFSKSRTTKHFVVAMLFCRDPKRIDKLVNKTFAGFTKTETKSLGGVLHTYKLRPAVRKRLLRQLQNEDVSVLVIMLNKEHVHIGLQDAKHALYNYVVNILLDRLIRKKLFNGEDDIKIVASRRETSKFLNENFVDYLRHQAARNHSVDISVSIKTPKEEKGLQIADLLAWSFFYKYERGDASYVDIISEKVVEENWLFGR